MVTNCQCLILAAGKGTRLLPLTRQVPKPLFPLLNVPAIEQVADTVLRAGISRVAINCHHLAERLMDWGRRSSFASSILFLKEDILLDTGGAIKNALEWLGKDLPILIYNSDVLSNVDIPELVSTFYRFKGASALLCLHDHPRFNKIGYRDHQIVSFDYYGKGSLAYTGIGILSPDALEDFPPGPFSLVTALKSLISKGKKVFFVRGEEILAPGETSWLWHDIGTPKGYLDANFALLQRQGLDRLIGDCKLGKGVRLGTGVIVGHGATVEDHVHLERTVVWPGSLIKGPAHIKDCIITPFGNLSINSNQNMP